MSPAVISEKVGGEIKTGLLMSVTLHSTDADLQVVCVCDLLTHCILYLFMYCGVKLRLYDELNEEL